MRPVMPESFLGKSARMANGLGVSYFLGLWTFVTVWEDHFGGKKLECF